MKNLILCFVLCLCTFQAIGQLKVGFRAGLSTTSLSPEELTLFSQEGREELLLKVEDANFGILGGLVFKIELGGLFLQPELIFSSTTVDFDITQLTSDPISSVARESYQNLDIPIMLGYQASIFRFMGGLEGHFFVNSSSDLVDFENYSTNFSTFTVGWQLGFGVDISKLMIDLRYQGNFSNFGSHIVFAGQEFQFDESPSRLMLTAGLFF